jgi:sporulation protein YlmC with PRC-barrel domain
VQQLEEGERSSIDAERKPAGTNNTESVTSASRISEEFFPIRSLIGMTAYDNEAILVGNVHEIGLRKSSGGNIQIMVKISNQNKKNDSTNIQDREVKWTDISKIGDIVLLGNTKSDEETNRSRSSSTTTNQSRLCRSCGYANQGNAVFCEECGSKLS